MLTKKEAIQRIKQIKKSGATHLDPNGIRFVTGTSAGVIKGGATHLDPNGIRYDGMTVFNLYLSYNPPIVSCDIIDFDGSEYHVYIDIAAKQVAHMCDDGFNNWYQNWSMCKHIAKVLLLIDFELFQKIIDIWDEVTIEEVPYIYKNYQKHVYEPRVQSLKENKEWNELYHLYFDAYISTRMYDKYGKKAVDVFLSHPRETAKAFFSGLPEIWNRIIHSDPEIIPSVVLTMLKYSHVLRPVDIPKIVKAIRYDINYFRYIAKNIDLKKKCPLLDMFINNGDSNIVLPEVLDNYIKMGAPYDELAAIKSIVDFINSNDWRIALKNQTGRAFKSSIQKLFDYDEEYSTAIQNDDVAIKKPTRSVIVALEKRLMSIEPVTNEQKILMRKHRFLKAIATREAKKMPLAKIELRENWYRFYIVKWINLPSEPDYKLIKYIRKCLFPYLNKSGNLDYYEIAKVLPILQDLFQIPYKEADRIAKEYWKQGFPKFNSQNQQRNIFHFDLVLPQENINDYVVVQWAMNDWKHIDSFVSTRDEHYIYIPDPKSSLTDNIEPFDITLCERKPSLVENHVKTLRPVRKLSVSKAFDAVYKGFALISNSRHLKIINKMFNGEITIVKAFIDIQKYVSKVFIPNEDDFMKNVMQFFTKVIDTNQERVFQELIESPMHYKTKFLRKILAMPYYEQIFLESNPFEPFFYGYFDSAKSLPEIAKAFFSFIRQKLDVLIESDDLAPVNTNFLRKVKGFEKEAARIISLKREKMINALSLVKRLDDGRYYIGDLADTEYGREILGEVFSKVPRAINKTQLAILIQFIKGLGIDISPLIGLLREDTSVRSTPVDSTATLPNPDT